MATTVHHGDCRDVLPTLPAKSVHTCITSPPYFGLRSYLPDGHELKDRELGMERALDDYVENLVAVFREVRRVLRDDGTLWLNLGDTYASNWPCTRRNIIGQPALSDGKRANRPPRMAPGLKDKDLMMIPARVAIALQADGWWLRSDIIWHKPNPMPESATDRPTSTHEHVFLLTKADRYFYDAEAIREDLTPSSVVRLAQKVESQAGSSRANGGQKINGPMKAVSRKRGVPPRHSAYASSDRSSLDTVGRGTGRNARNVWTIATQPFRGAHFATMPPELAMRCIRAGTSEEGCCPKCGAPWRRIVEKGEPDLAAQRAAGGDATGAYAGKSRKGHDAAGVQNASDVKRSILAGMRHRRTAGWKPGCQCNAEPVPSVVLDPFGGVGTTGLAADRLRRDAVLVELHPEHVGTARERITADAPLFAKVG